MLFVFVGASYFGKPRCHTAVEAPLLVHKKASPLAEISNCGFMYISPSAAAVRR